MKLKLIPILAAVLALAMPATAQASSYLTVSFGRAQTGVVATQKTCNTSVVPVDMTRDVLPYLASKGLTATMDVQLSLVTDTVNMCQGTIRYATWADLQSWHALYGAEAVSAGDVVTNYSTLTDAQVLQHSCGTLQTFIDHGFTRADGMFATPSSTATAHQLSLFASCFGSTRVYQNLHGTPLPMPSPYKAFTYSLTGGKCNNPALPCYALTVKNGRVYPDPDAMIAQFNATPDNTWLNFQAYRFVTGSNASTTAGWDCTSDDWHDHYTLTPEVFCWNDYQHVIDGLRTDFVSVDPKAVTALQGR